MHDTMYCIIYHLTVKLKYYYTIPRVERLHTYQYTKLWGYTWRWWLTTQQCDMLTSGNTVEIKKYCRVEDCRYYSSDSNLSTIKIRLLECNGYGKIKALTTHNINTRRGPREHVHNTKRYVHFHLYNWDNDEFRSLFTNRYDDVIQFISSNKVIKEI